MDGSTGPAPRGFALAWAREPRRGNPRDAAARMAEVAGLRREGGSLVETAAGGRVVAHQLLGARPAPRVRRIRDGNILVVADCRLTHTTELATTLGLTPGTDDVALLVAAYRRWGHEVGEHLDGDYSAAIWDDVRAKLTMLRDPFAMRPIHHAEHEGLLLVASEIRMLHAAGVAAEVDEERLALQVCGAFGRVSHTYWLGTRALEMAETVIVGPSSMRSFSHWRPRIGRPWLTKSQCEAVEGLRDVLDRATTDRVEPGRTALALSGGVDSTNVALAAPRGSLVTITHAYEQADYWDERHVALPIARHVSAKALELPREGLGHLGYSFGWPRNDIATYDAAYELGSAASWRCMMEMARDRGCHTLIIANRGDDVVGSDIWDIGAILWSGQFSQVVSSINQLKGGKGAREFYREAFARLVAEPVFWRFGPRAWEGLERLRGRGTTWFQPPAYLPRARWTEATENYIYRSRLHRAPTRAASTGSIRRWCQLRSRASATLAEMWERQGAMLGVEIADPWADRRVAELVLGMPQWIVASPTEPKGIAVRLAAERVPAGVAPLVDFHLNPVHDVTASEGKAPWADVAFFREMEARRLLHAAAFAEQFGSIEPDGPIPFSASFVLDAEHWLRCWAPLVERHK